MTPRVLRICWHDSGIAASTSDYSTAEASDEGLKDMMVVGHLVFENEELYCLAATQCGEGHWRGVQWIPKVCVSKTEELT